jgi:serine/threonine protein kinase
VPKNSFNLGHDLGFHTDICALGVALAKVRCGFVPFAEEYNSFHDGVVKMEWVMGPMPNPYRILWKDWGGLFINSLGKEGKPRDDDTWKDETVFVTIDPEKQERVHQSRVKEGRAREWLRYRLEDGLVMAIAHEEAADIAHEEAADIAHEEAADIAAQAGSTPARLPTYKDNKDIAFEELQKPTMDKTEIDQMFDLFCRIFRWLPAERATLDQIANHEWFGDRNRRQHHASWDHSHPENNNNKNNDKTRTTTRRTTRTMTTSQGRVPQALPGTCRNPTDVEEIGAG